MVRQNFRRPSRVTFERLRRLDLPTSVCLLRTRSLSGLAERSADQALNDLATELAQLLKPTCVVIGQSIVIESEQSQQRDVEITNVMNLIDGRGARFVGRTDNVARVAAAASEPDRHRVGIVISAIRGSATYAVIG